MIIPVALDARARAGQEVAIRAAIAELGRHSRKSDVSQHLATGLAGLIALSF